VFESIQHAFAAALLDPERPVPNALTSHTARVPTRRFAVYRNNVAVGLVDALARRFPATQRIVGEEFFRAMARLYVQAEPPRSPLLMQYGDTFADFIARFPPAAEIVYLVDVARLEAARTRAHHAADAAPLDAGQLQSMFASPFRGARRARRSVAKASEPGGVTPRAAQHEHFAPAAPHPAARFASGRAPLKGRDEEAIGALRFVRHPAAEIVRSPHPVVTIWAMNAGELELGPIEDWRGEDALVTRPALEVQVRALPPGGAAFLLALFSGAPLAEAAAAGQAEHKEFDLTTNLAGMLSSGAMSGVAYDK
jgi:hypothetical protein